VRRFVIAFAAALAWTTAARAQPDTQGAACEASYDCGDLRCIGGVCVALDGARPRALPPESMPVTAGTSAMLGDGKGYVPVIIGVDATATLAVGVLVGLAVGTGQEGFAIAALFPTTLAAPLFHAAYGRPIPALISFLAWASLAPTSVFFGAFGALGSFNGGLGILLGGAVAAGGAIGLTALDAYFARSVRLHPDARPTTWSWSPSLAPTRDGLTASIVGTF
jgi:hypothetical protein